MSGQKNEQKISPFYRTSSPTGAAAQKPESPWYHKSLGPKKSKIATHDANILYCLKEARQKYHEPKLAKLFAGAGLGAERARASTVAGLWVRIWVHSADFRS